MKKDYKIEMKPTYWEVTLERGAYSDREEEHLYFCANSQEEVWHFLKRYLNDIWNREDWDCIGAVILTDAKGNTIDKYATEGYKKKSEENDWEIDYDIEYGNAWGVTINRLNVIYFNK